MDWELPKIPGGIPNHHCQAVFLPKNKVCYVSCVSSRWRSVPSWVPINAGYVSWMSPKVMPQSFLDGFLLPKATRISQRFSGRKGKLKTQPIKFPKYENTGSIQCHVRLTQLFYRRVLRWDVISWWDLHEQWPDRVLTLRDLDMVKSVRNQSRLNLILHHLLWDVQRQGG